MRGESHRHFQGVESTSRSRSFPEGFRCAPPPRLERWQPADYWSSQSSTLSEAVAQLKFLTLQALFPVPNQALNALFLFGKPPQLSSGTVQTMVGIL